MESVASIARRLGRSTKTIFRWKAAGVNIFNESELLSHAEHCDLRARGRSAQLVWDRPTGPSAISGSTNAPSTFFNTQQALSVLAGLDSLKSAFSKRLAKAQSIGDELESGLISEELAYLTEAHRLVDIVCEGFEV